jgi:hypothetical protein
LIVEIIDNYFAEYPVSEEEPDAVDTGEVITAIAKTVAELTCGLDNTGRQDMIERLMREVMEHDAEFREQDAMGPAASGARH